MVNCIFTQVIEKVGIHPNKCCIKQPRKKRLSEYLEHNYKGLFDADVLFTSHGDVQRRVGGKSLEVRLGHVVY